MPLTPVAWWLATSYGERWTDCVATHPGAEEQTFTGPCASSLTISALAQFALIPLAATTIVALIIGLVEGRRRRRFAHGRWICATIVTLTGPWTMLTYAIGYGLGRLLPPSRRDGTPRTHPTAMAYQQGWHTAGRLYTTLAAGQPLPQIVAPGFLNSEPVHLDAPFRYARYYGMPVNYQPATTLAVGSPAFVAGAAIGGLLANGIGHARAASMSRTRWREHRTARVVVTASTTWCCVDGRWLAFDHTAVMGYHLDGANCLLTFADVEPLMLTGPSAACHAVIFAYLRGGAWQHQPFLHPVAATAPAAPLGPR